MPKFETKVGDKLFTSDRRYSDPESVRYQTKHVVGETRVSWLVSEYADVKPEQIWYLANTVKVSKKVLAEKGVCNGYYVSHELLEQERWVRSNGWRVSKAVDFCHDYDKLKQIADIIGYKEETK